MPKKERLDITLVEKGYAKSREKAKSLIMSGVVFVNGQKEDKPGLGIRKDSVIELKDDPNPYVSRGGLKIEKALREFNINLDGKVTLDIGASTGGFTDCMLKNGAKKVYAIDVGYGQLAWSLRNDSRVVCMEKTNIRYVKPCDLQEKADFASIDVSFISLKKVIPPVSDLLTNDGELLCLIKPQFEAGREKVGKNGVVRDSNVHIEVFREIVKFVVESGFFVKGVTYSPIKGPEGNVEYFVYVSKSNGESDLGGLYDKISIVARESHKELNGG